MNKGVTIEIFYFKAKLIEYNDIKSLFFVQEQNQNSVVYAYFISN